MVSKILANSKPLSLFKEGLRTSCDLKELKGLWTSVTTCDLNALFGGATKCP